MMAQTYIKQYGLPRSGTNILKALLEENFDVRVLNLILGSKHLEYDPEEIASWKPSSDIDFRTTAKEFARIKEDFAEGRLGYSLIIKNVYAWLVSLHRYRSGKSQTPLEFDIEFVEPNVELWVTMNMHWLDRLRDAPGVGLVVVSYEDLLMQPSEVLEDHASCFGLTPRREQLKERLPFAAVAGGDADRGFEVAGSTKFDSSYYTERRYQERFDDGMRGAVEEKLKGELAPEMQELTTWY